MSNFYGKSDIYDNYDFSDIEDKVVSLFWHFFLTFFAFSLLLYISRLRW